METVEKVVVSMESTETMTASEAPMEEIAASEEASEEAMEEKAAADVSFIENVNDTIEAEEAQRERPRLRCQTCLGAHLADARCVLPRSFARARRLGCCARGKWSPFDVGLLVERVAAACRSA